MDYQPKARICIGCWQWMKLPIPLRGVAAIPFRLFGIRPSRMNPNTCTICELMFKRIMKKRQLEIDATILFADLRGYTSLTQARPEAVTELLDDFYDECSTAIWSHDGLLNKAMGDSVMAIFNFPIVRADHPRHAVAAARGIQERWQRKRWGSGQSDAGIGIGIACGQLSFGEFGRAGQDWTAIGSVVNTAARAQAVALGGEILLTEAVFERVPEETAGSQSRDYQLKGFETATKLYALPSI
jgi:class 3 adenylate cyclase